MLLDSLWRRTRAVLSLALAAAFGVATPLSAETAPQAAVVTQSGHEISISGQIVKETLQTVQRELSAPGGDAIDTIILESTGGDLDSTIELGRIIHARRMTVRVQRVCAALCAALLAPAPAHLVVPKGAFLVIVPIISPEMLNANRTNAEAQSKPGAGPSNSKDRIFRMAVERQDQYFKELNIVPDRIYGFGAAVGVLDAALAAAGKPDRPLIVPDSSYMHKCLGVPSVDMPDYTVSDSKTFAHVGKSPIAFLIDGKLVYDGAKVATFQPPCLSPG